MYLTPGTLLQQRMVDWEMSYQTQTLWFMAKLPYHRQPTAHSRGTCKFRSNVEAFDGSLISGVLWSPRSSYLTQCDLSLWGSLKLEVYKTNTHNLEEPKNICHEISTFARKISRGPTTTCSADCIRSEDNSFGICCSSGKFLLDFLQVTIITIICVAPLADCCPTREAAYEARQAERAVAASR